MENNNKKYKFVESKNGLHRIKALRDFGSVKKGDLGGWVYSESNLSHEGDCWIADDARVTDYAFVGENAIVRGFSLIEGEAIIRGDSRVEDSHVSDYAVIEGNASVRDAVICDYARIGENAQLWDSVKVRDNAIVCGRAKVFRYVWVTDDAYITGDACVSDYSEVIGDAWVGGNAHVGCAVTLAWDAVVASNTDFVRIQTHNYNIVGYKSRWITVYDCSTGDALSLTEYYKLKKEQSKSEQSRRELLTIIQMMKIYLGKIKRVN